MKHAKCEVEKKFLLAAEHRDLDGVSNYLKDGVSPNARKVDRVTALHIAAERGDVDLATILLSSKETNLNAFTIHGYTPLIVACISRQDDFVKYLLDHGADVNLPERFGKTAIHHAAFMDCLSIAKILIDHGADINLMDVFYHTPLSVSTVDRHFLPMVKLLIENGADINMHRGGIVLHLFLEACLACSSEKHLEIVIYLLDNGVNPNLVDLHTNRNALHYFAINNYIPLGRLLVARGTDLFHKDFYNIFPDHLAKQQNNMEAVDFLENLHTEQRLKELCEKL